MTTLRFLCFISFILVLCGVHSRANGIEVNAYNFYGPSPYTEIYLRSETGHLKTARDEQGEFVALHIILIVSDDQERIVAYDNFILKQAVEAGELIDMLDVKRFVLPEGQYSIKLEVKDFNDPVSTVEVIKKWKVLSPQTLFSDIVPVALYNKAEENNPLVKNGIYIEPLPYHYVDTSFSYLDFYLEIYPSTDVSDNLLMYEIKAEGSTNPVVVKYKKLKNNPVEVLILNLPLDNVISGKYSIGVSLIDKDKNRLIATETDLMVSNVKADLKRLESDTSSWEDTFVQDLADEDMDYILKAHLPITDQHLTNSLRELIKNGQPRSQKQFIFTLWNTKIPENPEEGFKKYMEVARAVDKKFYIAAGYGFQSDRGHIFLKYGKPYNIISIDTETDAYPYEIWYYDYLPFTGQTNVRFIFFNPSLSNSDYILLHSTCYGERMDPTWEQQIYKSVLNADMKAINVDNPNQVPQGFNRMARRYFNEY